MKIQLLYAPGCPHVEATRETLRRCLDGLGIPDPVWEREGDYPSPTLRVDEVDVMGQPSLSGAACRLDLPTEEAIVAALRRAGA